MKTIDNFLIAGLKYTSSVMRILALLIVSVGFSFLAGCKDDSEDINLSPFFDYGDPQPVYWPGDLFADSVDYMNNDSLMLFGHFKPKQKNIDVIQYGFRVHGMPQGAGTEANYVLQKNIKWLFADLDTVVMSQYKIANIKTDSATFDLWIEVVNPWYNPQVDPLLAKTYYIVSNNSVKIKHAKTN
jgi:hypothetical protein